ncbi:MAG: hypothetical protein B6241_01800 [Spirochaetaceae bacterium 4572_59]|nr:MAG: hypothetical protein B6241_01800 [Spirochaetaceae bacterium 4572_59]
MKLSTKSRYALRLMVNLTFASKKEPVQLNEIAKREEVSEKYLSQIVIFLRGAGLIQSVRGAKGGYLLNKAPSLITVKDIVEVMEGGLNIVDCLNEDKYCQRSEKCVTKHVWDKVSRAISQTLEEISLEDLASQVQGEMI